MFNDKKNANQIIRFDRNGCFVEFLSDAFEINRLKINFIQYSGKGGSGKATNRISIYLASDEFLFLANTIENGMFFQKANQLDMQAQQSGNKTVNYYESPIGGSEVNGKTIARSFKIQKGRPGKNGERMWNLFAAEYPGKRAENRLILIDGKMTSFANVPVSTKDLFALAALIKIHSQAYVNFVYNRYGNKIFNNIDNDGGYTTYFYENGSKGGQQPQNFNQSQGQGYQPQQQSQQQPQQQGYQQGYQQQPQQQQQQQGNFPQDLGYNNHY